MSVRTVAYENVSEYIRDLIRRDKERSESEAFDRLKAELNRAFAMSEESYKPLSAAEVIAREQGLKPWRFGFRRRPRCAWMKSTDIPATAGARRKPRHTSLVCSRRLNQIETRGITLRPVPAEFGVEG